MKVAALVKCLETFQGLPATFPPVEITVGQPWHMASRFRDSIDFATAKGVYVFAEPPQPDWNIPVHLSDGEIWYIGKTDDGLAKRIWAHFTIYDPETHQVPDPRFLLHNWRDHPSVSDHIKKAIAEGNTVVYPIRTEPIGNAPGWPNVVEKFLLACCYRASGALPPLNLEI